ncbi:hypothetical protein JWJ88_17615 [Paracoccus methylovorus]|uniref:Uncharacterized protein n=1 Tax=Paracoccus methylovorus TaxID=2812658 RepID=A0ABX7JKL5_9RHOB|nr:MULTISPECIES: hypothetical protein [Paracoccus]QRZ14777.1 hypothetical protein JWJ88_17615 [Paracoccus methylovorus]
MIGALIFVILIIFILAIGRGGLLIQAATAQVVRMPLETLFQLVGCLFGIEKAGFDEPDAGHG